MFAASSRGHDRVRSTHAAAKRSRLRRLADAALIAAALALVAVLPTGSGAAVAPNLAVNPAPTGQGLTITTGDLRYILKQIKISEEHAATLSAAHPCDTLVNTPGDGIPDALQVPDRLTSYGLRTVDGSCNDLFPNREKFGSADQPFPRLTPSRFRDAENVPPGFGPPGPTSYKQKKGLVFDSEPRTVSNLIVDQTSTNPAAIAAAGFPVRTQQNPETHVPCTTEPDLTANPPVAGVPAGCVPAHHTLFIPNVTTDVGLSPPYNSMFTFFGQFFDHGVDQTVKSGGTVFVPLKADDPLIAGPNHVLGDADDLPVNQRFMVLTRAQNQPGPDGILGDRRPTDAGPPVPCTSLNVPAGCDESADDVQDANNTDSPWVDQSQTYTSHASHQAFLREYTMTAANRPVDTGKLLGGNTPNGATGMATWSSVKEQAATKLGLKLRDVDALNVPALLTDPYGNFIPAANGLPQYVTDSGLVPGNLANPVPVPADVKHFDTPFLTDIAHNADPGSVGPCTTPIGTTPRVPTGCLSPDADTTASADFAHQPAGTYDDEMLDAHFCAGDGRVNENIALTTIHQVFHSEHDRLVEYIKGVLESDTSPAGIAALADWRGGPTADAPHAWNYGQRLFQAARFVTEMEYQHLVFEEFARKVQPAIRPFHIYTPDVNGAIPAEFAHAVYRFGHSMLDDDVARRNMDGSDNSVPLLTAFLNPPEFYNGGSAGTLTPEQAAGSVVMGSSDQTGNELDEFVTETLRNNLLGLPLDLPTLNMARARDAGVPPLNVLRRQIHADTNDAQLAPYTSWSDFGQHLKHPESLINFVAAYGRHPTITGADTLAGKRAAAQAIVDPTPGVTPPADAAAFMNSTGTTWSDTASGASTTGVDDIDLWVGGLAEVTNLNGGLLGSTFNYVFQLTLENLQEADRFYYLFRTPGMNLRTQLEGNSFAELIQRNTDGTNTLKADAFATADCKFQLANLAGTPDGFTQFGATVADDPGTPDCDESKLLLRKPDGTIQYRLINSVDPPGINGQSVYNGTSAADRIFGGNDNDTFWGGLGNDIIEGNNGDDVALGGEGNDRITDLNGADVLKGGPGNDSLDAGPGDDIVIAGDGSDFTNGGANDNETFGGPGNDFIIAGQGADAVFGDGGDDWIEGGTGQDLLQGDHGAPFFDDPAENAPGNDVFVGQAGENDYDTEGGDDLMAQNAAIDRNAGSGGWDWAFHQYDSVGANDDMEINNNLLGLPLPVVVNRDRWQETEADSGSAFDDVMKGDDIVPSGVAGGGFTGCNVLDQAGLDRISGLDPLVPPLAGDARTDLFANAASGTCPLSGPYWGDGNILLGGAGSDTITGRGANDIIDGDKALQVRISVRDPNNRAVEVGSTDLMEHPYDSTGKTLQAAVADGTVDPGDLTVIREIVSPPASDAASIDTAQFAGPRSNYSVTFNGATITVTQTGPIVAGAQKVSDGRDTIRNVERLQFSDQTIAVGPRAAVATTAAFAARQLGTAAAPQTIVLTNTGNQPLHVAGVALAGPNASDFAIASNGCGAALAAGANCDIGMTFTPSAAGTRRATLTITDDSGPGGSAATHDVALTGEGTVGPPPANTTPEDSAKPQDTTGAGDDKGAGDIGAEDHGSDTGGKGGSGKGSGLLAATVSVSAKASAPITVSAEVPAGAKVVSITVFRLDSSGKGKGGARAAATRRVRVARVFRAAPTAKRYVFRLTESALRHLKPGRYLIEIRVGATRADLGPATTRTVTIRGHRAKR